LFTYHHALSIIMRPKISHELNQGSSASFLAQGPAPQGFFGDGSTWDTAAIHFRVPCGDEIFKEIIKAVKIVKFE
jgi:hypothetical protein